MEPEPPTLDDRVAIAGIEARPEDIRPGRQRGETTTISVWLDHDTSIAHESSRYRSIKAYEQYAGEAAYDNLLGGRPTLREHPIDDWPVDSHVVPVVYGDELYVDTSFWGLVTGVEDNSTVVGQAANPGYGDSYGDSYGGGPTDNIYSLQIELVILADIDEYDDREALLADLSPDVGQLAETV